MPRRCCLVLLSALCSLSAGCNIVGSIVLLTHPPRMQDAEVEFAEDARLAVLVDYARPADESPVFTHAFVDRFTEILRNEEITNEFVPHQRVLALRQSTPGFRKWSVQRIGREIEADEVVYVQVERLQLQERGESPLLMPSVTLRLKLIDTDDMAAMARRWPAEKEGRALKRERPPREARDQMLLDAETRKLARECAWLAAKFFYKYDLEAKDPWEP
jgi:hypothetical protein